MIQPIYDKPEDLKTIEEEVLPGEEVKGVFELLGWYDRDLRKREKAREKEVILLAITSKRILTHHSMNRNTKDSATKVFSILLSSISSLGIQTKSEIRMLVINIGSDRQCLIGGGHDLIPWAREVPDLMFHSFRDNESVRQAYDLILAQLLSIGAL